MDAIRTRRSVRAYAPEPIGDDVMARMKDALRFAPSACNFQPWRFVLVLDAHARRKLAEAANRQMWLADAPAIVVGVGLPKMAYARMGGARTSVEIDVTIALDHLTLAAAAEGLGTCWVGAFDETKVKELLSIPDELRVVALTPLGRPAEKGLLHPLDPKRRKPPVDVFNIDRFSWTPQHPDVDVGDSTP
jgi:nitroreductase